MNRVWSDEERNFIKNNAEQLKDLEIAQHLSKTCGRSVSLQAVRKQRQKMGISKKPGRGICALTNGDITGKECGVVPHPVP